MRACILSVLLLSWTHVAAADVVGPEESISCPDGSRASTNHCGTNCFAPPCTSDADCDASERCATVPFCVEQLMCGRGGAPFPAVRDSCAGGCTEGSCTELRTCFDADRVEPDGTVVPENVTYGCGCRASGAGSTGLGPLGLVILAAWRLRRRR